MNIQMFYTNELDDYSTVQKYVCSLFQQLPCVEIQGLTILEDRQTLVQRLLFQNKHYGKKILELSDKFTSKYRKDNFIVRSDIEPLVLCLYQFLTEKAALPNLSIYQMIETILCLVKESNYRNFQPKQKQIDNEPLKIKFLHDSPQLNSNSRNQSPSHKSHKRFSGTSKCSRPRTRIKENLSIKKILQIKGYFQLQQNIFRDFYNRINRILEQSRISILNIDPNKLKLFKCVKQNVSNYYIQNPSSICELVRTCTEDSSRNLTNLQSLCQLIHEDTLRKTEREAFSSTLLTNCFKEIDKKEQVYSYAVSKLLENLLALRNLTTGPHGDLSLKLIDNLEEISRKFYQLYPSCELLRDIAVQPLPSLWGHHNQYVQVNTIKQANVNEENRGASEVYRIQIIICEHIGKFERSLKHRKTLECKQVLKMLDNLKALFHRDLAHAPADITVFQEDIRKLIQANQRSQNDLKEAQAKASKKYEKTIGQFDKTIKEYKQTFGELQAALADALKEVQKCHQEHEAERKKHVKKLDAERSECRTLLSEKDTLEKNIVTMLNEIEQMKKTINRQTQFFGENARYTNHQKQRLEEGLAAAEAKTRSMNQQLQLEHLKRNQERDIYQQKILLLQGREEQHKVEKQQASTQLAFAMQQNVLLKKQVTQLSDELDVKSRQCTQALEQVRDYQKELSKLQSKLEFLVQTQANGKKLILELSEELSHRVIELKNLREQKNSLRIESDKFREMSLLNSSDIDQLRQEMDKMNEAYVEAYEQIETLRAELQAVSSISVVLQRDKQKMASVISQLELQLQSLRLRQQSFEQTERDAKQELILKAKESSTIQLQHEQRKKQISRLAVEITELRQKVLKHEQDNRSLRQQLQQRKETEGVESSKKRIQLQNIKVELRKKTQAMQRQKDTYEQKQSMLTQKLKEMEQLLAQKQLLCRITNTHQSQ